MSDGTKISWAEATWNPTSGCTKVSAGCDHCYIDRTPPFRMAHRKFDKPGIGGTTGVVLHGDRLMVPLHWRKPRRVFVNSLSDLFHGDVSDIHIAKVFATMARAPQHSYQVLTKRPARMRSLLSSADFRALVEMVCAHPVEWPLPSVWLGVSTEDQKTADLRIPILLDTPAAVRWISAEPLLGPIDLNSWVDHDAVVTPCDLDWVVAGGESGPGARPAHPDWFQTLRDQCDRAGVPFHFKQWGEWGLYPPVKADGNYDWNFPSWSLANDGTLYEPYALSYPDGPRWGEAIRADHGRAHLHAVYRVGKRRAGRLLDGVVHDAYPAQTGVPV